MSQEYYKIEKLFTEAQIKELLNLHSNLTEQRKYAHQDYNIFDAYKTHIPSQYQNSELFDCLRERSGLQVYNQYFLEYGKDGFTRMHTDNDDAVGMTIVTLLYTSPDMKGGETLVTLPYTKRSRPEGTYAKRQAGEPPLNKRIIPQVVHSEDGDSMIYDRSLLHGVAKVTEGKRIVLVSWFSKHA